MEEKHDRRRRKQEKISVLYWFFRNNLVPPSSSRSFRTQFYWSYSTGQCRYSEQLLPVHLACGMCNQFTSIINSGLIFGGQSLSKRQTVFVLFVDPMDKNHQDETSEHGKLGWYQFLFWRKDWSSVEHDRTPSFFAKHSQNIVVRKLLGWELKKSFTRRCIPRSLWSMIGWKNWVQKLPMVEWTSCSTIQKFLVRPTKFKPRSW